MLDYSRAIFENSRDAIIVHRKDCTILDANQATCDLLGYKLEDLIGKKISDFSETQMPLEERNLKELKEKGNTIFERVVVSRDGRKLPVEVSNSIMKLNGEEMVIAVIRDLGAWYQFQTEKQDSEERFRSFVEQSMEGIILIDGEGLIREWNHAIEITSGLSKEKVIGTPIWVIHERLGFGLFEELRLSAENYQPRLKKSMETGISVYFNRVHELDYTNLSGEVRTIRLLVFPIKKKNDVWIGFIVHDINEIKKKEQDIINSESRLKAILTNVQTGIIVVDPSNHTIIDMNPAAMAMFGATRESIIGTTCHNFICPSEAGKCPVTDLGQSIESSERVLIRHDRSRIPILKTVTTFLMDGRTFLLESFVDISERKTIEQRLRHSEERLRLLTSNLKDVIYRIDLVPKFRFSYISSAVESFMGYTLEEVQTAGDPSLFMHPDDMGTFRDKFFGPDRGWEKDASFRLRLRRKDGNYVWIDTRNSPIVGRNGQLIGIEGAARDISVEIKAQEDLNRNAVTDKIIGALSTKFMNLKISEIDAGVNESLAEIGTFIKADRCFIYLLDNENGRIIPTHSWAAPGVPDDDGFSAKVDLSHFPLIRDLMKTGDVVNLPDIRDHKMLSPQATKFLLDHHIYSMTFVPSIVGGSLHGYIGFSTINRVSNWDNHTIHMIHITGELLISVLNRKRMEERLNNERERLAVTLRSIGDGVITTDMLGNVILINKAGEEMTGWNQDEVRGHSLKEVFNIIETDTGANHCSNGPDASSGQCSLSVKSRLMSKTGAEKIVAISMAPIKDSSGVKFGTAIVFRDITAQTSLEEKLIKSQKIEAVGTLAGGLAHDFNNIMTAVLGNISLVKIRSSADGAAMARLEEAERSINKAKGLTSQLLTFSKGGAPIKKVTSPSELLMDTVDFALAGSNVKAHYDFSPDLLDIEADPQQISQVLNNIIVNSIEAMSGGGNIRLMAKNIVLDSSNPHSIPPGGYVQIVVSDDGPGMPPEVVERIFEPFFTTKSKGSGLGLYIVYSIIKNHGGSIEIASQSGAGTTFTINLPASKERAPERARQVSMEVPSAIPRILLMDDDSSILEVTSELLRYMGYLVECAHDGQEALRMYDKEMREGNRFNLVIMDLTVPGGMGGKEAIGHLISLDPKATAIVSSGYSDGPVMANFETYGFKGVMPKPYRIEQMSLEIERVLSVSND